MKRIIALLLCFMMLLSACGEPEIIEESTSNELVVEVSENEVNSDETSKDTNTENLVDETVTLVEDVNIDFSGLDDADLKYFIEDLVYNETIKNLDSTEFVVEEVRGQYLSKEYVEELTYNSQENIYFGYTLSELDEYFQGSRYVFTLGENGSTVVQEMQEIVDGDTNDIIKNIAIGSGVILLCVTVSVVSPIVGAPAAFTAIFAASAKSASVFALSSGMFGALSAAIVEGYQTGDFSKALDAAILSGSEGFKWGAISGAVIGGGKEAYLLKAATHGKLTMSEVALIQQESKLPLDIISKLDTTQQYEIIKDSGLYSKMINGKNALIRRIDLKYVDDLSGKTNLQLMKSGNAPIDIDGYPYELHHIGQKIDSPLAILTRSEHRQNGNDSIWHTLTEGFENPSKQPNWATIKKEFWKAYAELAEKGLI